MINVHGVLGWVDLEVGLKVEVCDRGAWIPGEVSSFVRVQRKPPAEDKIYFSIKADSRPNTSFLIYPDTMNRVRHPQPDEIERLRAELAEAHERLAFVKKDLANEREVSRAYADTEIKLRNENARLEKACQANRDQHERDHQRWDETRQRLFDRTENARIALEALQTQHTAEKKARYAFRARLAGALNMVWMMTQEAPTEDEIIKKAQDTRPPVFFWKTHAHYQKEIDDLKKTIAARDQAILEERKHQVALQTKIDTAKEALK